VSTARSVEVSEVDSSYPTNAAAAAERSTALPHVRRRHYEPRRSFDSTSQSGDVSLMFCVAYISRACGFCP
jgi:hypothetical protein